MTEKYQVIIVGGGLVGGTLAVALDQLGLSTCVIDTVASEKILSQPVDSRAYALSRSSVELFKSLTIWDKLTTTPCPISKIITADTQSGTQTVFQDNDPMGYLTNSLDLRRTILKTALNSPHITWKAPCSYQAIQINDYHTALTLDDGATVKAPLLLAADGRFSQLRDLMDISTYTIEGSQKALVFNVKHTRDHHGTAYEYFTPFGPLALLPYAPYESACVWSLDQHKAEDLEALSPQDLATELYAWFGNGLGEFTLSTEVVSYPLSAILPKKLTAQRFALIGDSAHAFHPVAGQGLNLGLSDVKSLCDILNKATRTGLDLGSQAVLTQYAISRKVDHLAMAAFCEGMVKAFSNQSFILKHARKLGIEAVENMPFLKNFMMKQAMGSKKPQFMAF